MKNLTIPLLAVVFLVFLIPSCRQNRLKTNEKELANEIFLQEKKKEESEKDSSDKNSENKNTFSGSLRKTEIRSVDPERPPVLIDIPGTRNNIREFKLSDIASSVSYIKLQTPPDTMLLFDHFFYRSELMSTIRSDGERIIFQGLFGVTCFNMEGEFLETIWKNETGIKFLGKAVGFGGQDFFGILPHIPVSLLDGNLLYNFQDGPGKKGQIIRYKLNAGKNISVQPQGEVPGSGIILGDTVFNNKKHWSEGFARIVGTGPDTWAGINDEWNSGRSGTLMVTFDEKGDTICRFSDYDRIVNFNAQQSRRAVELVSYSFDGLLTIKQEYNDTVFRLIPPDRLLPVYNIDFGSRKVNFMDGLNANYDLSEKYMLNSMFETNDYLLLRYTQNNGSPNNVQKNAVKFYNAFYYKKDSKLYHQPGFTLLPQGLFNDIDGGLPFWPDFITPQGEMMKLVSGKVIKDFVNSSGFKNSAVSGEKRQKLISMASGLRGTDMIIMIVR